MSPVSGTSFDPYNQLASVGLVEKLGRLDVFPGYDRELWDFFTKELWVWRKEDVEKALAIPAIVSWLFVSHPRDFEEGGVQS